MLCISHGRIHVEIPSSRRRKTPIFAPALSATRVSTVAQNENRRVLYFVLDTSSEKWLIDLCCHYQHSIFCPRSALFMVTPFLPTVARPLVRTTPLRFNVAKPSRTELFLAPSANIRAPGKRVRSGPAEMSSLYSPACSNASHGTAYSRNKVPMALFVTQSVCVFCSAYITHGLTAVWSTWLPSPNKQKKAFQQLQATNVGEVSAVLGLETVVGYFFQHARQQILVSPP